LQISDANISKEFKVHRLPATNAKCIHNWQYTGKHFLSIPSLNSKIDKKLDVKGNSNL
jgi:hypothetical protein